MKTAKPKTKSTWEYIGECGVDSGQLMVCDPCYLENEWDRTEKPLGIGSVYEDTVTGQKWSYHSPGNGVARFPGTYDTPIPECDNRTPNDLIASKRWRELPKPEPSGEFSYSGACQATLGKKRAGQLHYRRGHAGAGVVFSSGYGDGCYPVHIRRNREGRIIEARIKIG